VPVGYAEVVEDSVLVGPESSLVVHEYLEVEVDELSEAELNSAVVDDSEVVDSSGMLTVLVGRVKVEDVSAEVDEVSVSIGSTLLEVLLDGPGQSCQWL
jgi:hypothetical protein